mmetsp:Transcript_32109/g.64956  ORF Transcript_32109/g.64956 Transcript_32109/m.64956 type:complete len:280 (-) Transcript_32109:32-871(-)|eukprot:CAMPEP_0113387910 /NCGR_PEP_ID=MMETSP0013_2-20120614/8799_1 /TAXON_ID=2843 ORGANISM="Skeletonema costatum, Strain 1716" /NCGR_SAMPLE_ID=MMETSP0013_2 /ASSEMBLY_ACC=CAM_ASM_000158 /LENGTH=279 /DNA_ID=CAMNT_0000270859 /DNA_START=119 /DNA_END=958 /DNA_ORIENTATION=+ /assembly_acc=CAM_ASM_000158
MSTTMEDIEDSIISSMLMGGGGPPPPDTAPPLLSEVPLSITALSPLTSDHSEELGITQLFAAAALSSSSSTAPSLDLSSSVVPKEMIRQQAPPIAAAPSPTSTSLLHQENGAVQVSGFDMKKMEEAKEMITLLTSQMGGGGRGSRGPKPEYVGPEPEVGKVYTGKITGIHNFGVFLEILPGAEDGSTPGCEGLCHVSELHVERVRNTEGFIRSMNTETLEVVYQGKNNKGKYQLSRKAVLEQKGVKARGDSGPPRAAPQEMSKDEVSVISQAIENAITD